jgi:lipopolysaccharide biosynthesis glycosyltransferase
MRAEVSVLAAVPDGSGLMELSSGKERAGEFSKLGRNIHHEHYYCSGLLLMNLKELRNRDFTTAWRVFFGKYVSMIKFPDQDIYNWFFQPPEVVLLDFSWGEFSSVCGCRGVDSHRVVHYAKNAPWQKKITMVSMLWWEYVRKHIKKSRFSVKSQWMWLTYNILRNPIFFNLIYGITYVTNRKGYLKRKWELCNVR